MLGAIKVEGKQRCGETYGKAGRVPLLCGIPVSPESGHHTGWYLCRGESSITLHWPWGLSLSTSLWGWGEGKGERREPGEGGIRFLLFSFSPSLKLPLLVATRGPHGEGRRISHPEFAGRGLPAQMRSSVWRFPTSSGHEGRMPFNTNICNSCQLEMIALGESKSARSASRDSATPNTFYELIFLFFFLLN